MSQSLTSFRKTSNSCLESTQAYFPMFDLYARPINLLAAPGTQTYSTFCGVLLSLVTLIAVIYYSYF